MKLKTIFPLIIAAAILSTAVAQQTLQRPGIRLPQNTTVYRNLPYVTDGHVRQKLDLYLPKADDKLPLIIWVHGGAWFAGSKADGVPLEYLSEGYAVASINYRLSQHAVFPAQIQDCKAAVRWLRANA
jgi:acetyl esterase/lipase